MRSAIAIGITVLLLAGCATPTRIEQMAAAPRAVTQSADPTLRNAISVTEVTGGRETNPMWTSQVSSDSFHRALEMSLQSAGLHERLAARSRFRLIADISRVDQPMFGIDMTVSSTVRYSLIDTSSKKEVYGRVITVAYTAKISDAFLGAERLKLANEGSMRANIEKLVEDLLALKLP